MQVKIMRGAPGAGKSTYIKEHLPTAKVASADKFFELKGSYNFNASKLPEAHKWCMQYFLACIDDKEPLIVVDNTNIRHWEFSGYVQVAQARGYDVEIIRMDTPGIVAAARNIHGVPEAQVGRMMKGFEATPKWLKETVVKGY
jgi:NEDD4-binding protein 2